MSIYCHGFTPEKLSLHYTFLSRYLKKIMTVKFILMESDFILSSRPKGEILLPEYKISPFGRDDRESIEMTGTSIEMTGTSIEMTGKRVEMMGQSVAMTGR
jgi:hypothetical protein